MIWNLPTKLSNVKEFFLLNFQPVVDYLKIDVEGAEYESIQAMFQDEMLQHVKQIGLEVRNSQFAYTEIESTKTFVGK